MADTEITAYLEGVVGVVEATSYEKNCLWLHFAKDAEKYGGPSSVRFDWQETGHGYGPTVGFLADMPVAISILTATVAGNKLLFWHAMSVVADHRLIEEWFKKNLPTSAFREGARRNYVNQTDANNFIDIIPHETRKAA